MPKSSPLIANQSMWLYRLVFCSSAVRFFVVWLLLWLLLQPALVVFANEATEDLPSDTAAAADSATAPAIAVPEEVTAPTVPESTDEVVEAEPVTASAEAQTEIVESPPGDGTVEAERIPPPSEDKEPTEAVSATSSTPTLPSSTATTTNLATSSADEVATSTAVVATTTLTTPEAAPAPEPIVAGASSTASTSEPAVTQVRTQESYYQFSRDDCVRVEDGSFYCGEAAVERPADDRFYVALDRDGDREIFAVHDGDTVQITHNQVDDAAPYYDAASETLVWHRLIDGRYQVMSYDFDRAEETQLTHGRANSMEPTRYGTHTVWQQWVGDDWEIVLFDGASTTQLSSNEVPDIAPSIQAGYVIWKRVFADEQVAVIYDLTTGSETTVDGAGDGTAVAHARLMLVYEGVTDTGDRIIQGVDPRTGAVLPIGTLPSDMPDQIPDSEPTEAVRALITPKPTLEEEELPVGTPPATTSTSTLREPATPVATSTATTSDLTLVLPSTPVATPTSATNTATTTENPDFSLIIPPLATSSEA
jgi:hypothetical protein